MEKLTHAEFGTLMYFALNDVHLKPELRLGQALSNATNNFFPELADSLKGTGADCFYNDNKIIYFINAILK